MITEPAPRPEQVIARFRPHGRALLWPSLLFIAVGAGLGFFGGSFPEEWQNLAVLGLGGGLIILGWLVPLLSWLARSYTVTSNRTVLRSGLMVRMRQEVLHSRTLDITLRRKAVQLLFGTGDVLLNTGGPKPVVLRDIPFPRLVVSVIQERIDQSTQERQVR